jgi:hypothetical protein
MKEIIEDQEIENSLLTFLLSVLDIEEEKTIIKSIFESIANSRIIEDFIHYSSTGDKDDRN